MAFQLVAVGDCCYWAPPGKQREVSDQIMAIRPDQVVLLGDICQGQGGERIYSRLFDPTYGRIFDHPTIELTGIPGNHDRIADPHSRPFRKRFLGSTNINRPTWFAQDLNRSWKLIALDDNHRYIQEQNVWLRQQLKANRTSANPRQIVLAWHAPRFTIGGTSVNDNTRASVWWNLIHSDPYTRIILNGHQHSFRHKATRKNGYLRDVFIVGTGGGDKERPRNRYGVLVLNLRDPGGYRASYRQIYRNFDQRIGGPQGKVMQKIERGPQRIRVVDRSGSAPATRPEITVPTPPPTHPPASNPSNPRPPASPPSIRPPRAPQDPTKKSSYVRDGVLYVWG